LHDATLNFLSPCLIILLFKVRGNTNIVSCTQYKRSLFEFFELLYISLFKLIGYALNVKMCYSPGGLEITRV